MITHETRNKLHSAIRYEVFDGVENEVWQNVNFTIQREIQFDMGIPSYNEINSTVRDEINSEL